MQSERYICGCSEEISRKTLIGRKRGEKLNAVNIIDRGAPVHREERFGSLLLKKHRWAAFEFYMYEARCKIMQVIRQHWLTLMSKRRLSFTKLGITQKVVHSVNMYISGEEGSPEDMEK